MKKIALVLLVIVAGACSKDKRIAERHASEVAAKLVSLVNESALQVRRGLPLGAEKLSNLLTEEGLGDLGGVQRAVATARARVPDLAVAKSTFFAFADATGTFVRSEIDPDMLAGKSIWTAFPGLKPAIEAGRLGEAFGEMQEMRGVRNGPDIQWVVAKGVPEKSGVKGAFVTGWSFRRFAAYLEDSVKRDLVETTRRENKKNPPIVYIFIGKGSKLFGAPLTPDVNTAAVEALDLPARLKAGAYQGTLEIDRRTFGVAALPTPDFAPETCVAAIVSEI